MKFKNIILLALIGFSFSCSNTKKEENSTVDIENVDVYVEKVIKEINQPIEKEVVVDSNDNLFEKLVNQLPLRQIPCIDTTNFDNFSQSNKYSPKEIEILSIKTIYPKSYSEYKIFPSYRLNLSEDFKTIVITTFKGDHEMESTLINYETDGKIIDFKNISYDEIAEGWSRIESEISKKLIVITDILWLDEKQVKIERISINRMGEFKLIPSEFKSNIRPQEEIILQKLYIDTIQFISYNDEGDYPHLYGSKNNEKISLNYHLDEPINFIAGDYLEIEWAIDSIWIAGDGETLYFTEWMRKARNIDKAQFNSSDSLIVD